MARKSRPANLRMGFYCNKLGEHPVPECISFRSRRVKLMLVGSSLPIEEVNMERSRSFDLYLEPWLTARVPRMAEYAQRLPNSTTGSVRKWTRR